MDATNGKAYIFDCRYSTLCRQIVTDDEGRIQEFDFKTDDALVTLKAKLYIPSTLNTDYLLWHTQLIVCAVRH